VSERTRTVTAPGADYQIRVIGVPRTPLRDLYHAILRASWPATFALIAVAYLAINALFAVGYLLTGGMANARAGSFADAFFFSVQTMGTIGYGAISPASTAANLLVVAESLTGLILTAMATGIVFARFSRPSARVEFTREVVITPVDGVPTLSFRLGNQRGNQIVDAQIRVVLTRTETTLEGRTFYRMYDLTLVRDRTLSLTRSFTVMHKIDATSPLFGADATTVAAQDVELTAMVVGIDDITMQAAHAAHRWTYGQLRWRMRHVDILEEVDPQLLVVDLRRFHETEPT
jgi:inward rectifier potassium channel